MIFTWGYLTGALDTLQRHQEARRALIVDVRYTPFSRAPAFRRGPLARVFGPDYLWVRAFGNRNYKTPGAPIELVDPVAGLELLDQAGVGLERPALLLCGCREASACHRATVARFLHLERGWLVEHL